MPTYKLRSGVHAEGGKVYRKGDVFESSCNLLKLNAGPTSIRFEKIDDGPVSAKPKPEPVIQQPKATTEVANPGYSKEELEEMKVVDLEGIAEELGLDTSEVSNSSRYRKRELINLIVGEE